jgi:hypothetical protein
MIVVDKKELNLDTPVTHNELLVSKWISDQKEKRGNDAVIKLIDITPLKKNQLVFKQPKGFDVSGHKVNSKTGVKEYWIYCDQNPKVLKNGEKYYPKKHLRFFREASFSLNGDAALLYFLLEVVDVKQFGFIVEDKEAMAKKKLDMRRNASIVENIILEKLTKEDVVKFAGRWGIKVDGKGDNELRDELWEAIKVMNEKARKSGDDDNKIFRQFIAEANSDGTIVKVGMYFYKALKDKLISFNPNNRTYFWTDSHEVLGGYIPPNMIHSKEEYIINLLTNDEKERNQFMMVLGGEVDKVAADAGDYKMIKSPMAKKAWAKKHLGLEIPLVRLEEGDKLIEEFLNKSKEQVPTE